MKTRNLIGSQVRRLRYQRHMTQEEMAEKLQMAGYDLTRSALAKVEARQQWVGDFELLFYTRVLSVQLADLFPPIDPQDERMYKTIHYFMTRRF